MAKKSLSVLIVLLIAVTGLSQPKSDKNKQAINLVCDKFMRLFVDGKVKEALELLKQNTVMTPGSIDSLKVTIDEQMETIFPQFGKMLSSEFIKEKKVKNLIAKRFYVIKLSKFFLKVDFTLYNLGTSWTITAFHYNEDPEELFE
jgi:hypothetical protein